MKIAVLVSGGVDSSVALRLLKEAGHEVEAFYLKIWLEDELSHLGDCPWEEDLSYVRPLCEQLGVPLHVISLQEAYHEKIVSYTIAEAKAGRTPNPDVLCNQFIKFGTFFEHIGPEFDKVASGHYAQIIEQNNTFYLKRSPDPIKDQTYFLCNLSQKQLGRLLFPIGHLTKEEVRALAAKYDLPTRARKDSQGICFLGKFKFSDFLREHLGQKSGPIVQHQTGAILGTHPGHWYFTIGQRQGIGLSGGPWYVVKKDPKTNTVFISNTYEQVDDERKNFEVGNFHWVDAGPQSEKLLVKVRHRTKPKACTLSISNEGGSVTLATKDQGIAAGQHAVFYDGETCLGSGVIL